MVSRQLLRNPKEELSMVKQFVMLKSLQMALKMAILAQFSLYFSIFFNLELTTEEPKHLSALTYQFWMSFGKVRKICWIKAKLRKNIVRIFIYLLQYLITLKPRNPKTPKPRNPKTPKIPKPQNPKTPKTPKPPNKKKDMQKPLNLLIIYI